jgi:hypothetical protein
MPATYTLISSNVLTTTTASITFSAIPSTYTDLVVRISSRTNTAGVISDQLLVTVNGITANYSTTFMGTTNSSTMFSDRYSSVSGLNGLYTSNGDSATSNTFATAELYIPSYTVVQNKPMSLIGMGETNATTARSAAHAFLSSNTAAITSINIACNGSFVSGSSFYLYGISNA